MTVLRAALYPRVSTEEQAKYGYSVRAQIDDLLTYCEENNIKVVDIYNDEGQSGGKPAFKRPAMARLLEDVRSGKVDIVLFTKLDRWFRNVKEYYKVQDILDEHGVTWRAIQEDYEVVSSAGRFKVNIMLSVAQQERERGAERVSGVLENKRKNREACFGGNAVPFGYMKQKDADGIMRLVKDPETQEACQEFWDILIKSNNLNKAIRHMDHAYGIRKDWKSWSRMTRSDFYCGVHRGVPDYCDPYVSVDDFLAFQERPTIKATPSGQVYLFRGLLRCPVCGHKLCGDSNRKSYGVYKSYRCTNRGRGCGNGMSVSEKKLEKELLNRLDGFLRDEVARVELEQAKPKPKPKNNLKALKEKHRRLTVAYVAGNMPDDQYLREDAELKALIAKAEQEAPPPPKDVTPLKELLESDFRSIYAGLTEEERQRFWQRIVKEIKMDGKKLVDVVFF
jgi:DNA invertase Pin-like site-specific DNA recombinase